MTLLISSPLNKQEPLLESYAESTNGTFRPEDDHHSAPVPPLPFTNLIPGKTADGKDLPAGAVGDFNDASVEKKEK